MSRVIFNADDFGLCEEANLAIAKAFQQGQLTSTSLLVNMPATQHALALYQQHGERSPVGNPSPLAVGLHFCLTSGTSLLPANKIPLLVDSTGRFRHSFFGLWRALSSSQRVPMQRQIEAELTAQWERALALGIEPQHLDSHQHTHMIPGVAEVVCRFAQVMNVPLRVSQEIPPRGAGKEKLLHPLRSFVGRLRTTILNYLATQPVFQQELPRRAQQCLGIWDSGHMTLPVLKARLAQIPANSTTEVIVHPGLKSTDVTHRHLTKGTVIAEGDIRFWTNPQRYAELEALTHPELKETLAQLSTAYTRWHNVPRPKHLSVKKRPVFRSI